MKRSKRRDRDKAILWESCLEGIEPAESLPVADREALLTLLAKRKMTTDEIAHHTRLTPYTVNRILTRIADREQAAAVAATIAAWSGEVAA